MTTSRTGTPCGVPIGLLLCAAARVVVITTNAKKTEVRICLVQQIVRQQQRHCPSIRGRKGSCRSLGMTLLLAAEDLAHHLRIDVASTYDGNHGSFGQLGTVKKRRGIRNR